MADYPTLMELVGRTPLVRLDRVRPPAGALLLAKLELLNPGGSVKDRPALEMIEMAERDGRLRPGGTIVEPTSGNTGVGLAIAAAVKGYHCIFVMPDKVSAEKVATLKAYGAEVILAPATAAAESPESFYSVAARLAGEVAGGFEPDQYSNQANPAAHYKTTGPEIAAQTAGRLDAVVLTVGTGGTITGVGRYFKEHQPEVQIIGVDPAGSIYSAASAADLHPYEVESIGKSSWPEVLDRSLVDEWIAVEDADSFAMCHRLAREEGLLVGGSGGTAVFAAGQVATRLGPDAVVVTLIPDGGRSYLSKVYDDDWLRAKGFAALVADKKENEGL